jgi:hypothetical protein
MPIPSSNRRSVRPKLTAAWSGGLETLERRQLLSSASISYANFSSTTGLTANGFGSTSPTASGELVMTDSLNNEARSVFYNKPVPFDHFTTHFSYRADDGALADGFTFALQENGPTAVGAVGGSLGYQNMGGNGAAVGFSIYNSGDYRVFSGNNIAYSSEDDMESSNPFIHVGNGDTYDFTITYDGTTLTTSVVDESNSANTYTKSFALDLNSVLNAHTAYVGFTAATGGAVSTQRILNWDYSGSDGLTITTPAAATPGTVTATTTALSVAATDTTNGGTLTYNWTLLHKPSGAATPTFADNNSANANDTTANFFKDGTYIFRATASNANGLFDVSDVSVIVHQTAAAVRVTPHAQSISRKSRKSFAASVTDQFGHAMRTQPSIAWSLLQGSGSIDASTGLFTAGSDRGHVVIQATDMLDALTGTIGATVV